MGKATAMKQLDKALKQVRELGLDTKTTEDTPIAGLLEEIYDLDPDNVAVIAKTLQQTSLFNEIVRNEISAMNIGERYEDIVLAFNSIRDDSKRLVDQMEDGKINTFERVANVWMKVRRGDISERFDEIRHTYLQVAKDAKDQIVREGRILNAYNDFRGAYKQAQVLALKILQSAEKQLGAVKKELEKASKTVAAYKGDDIARRAELEMDRDGKIRALQDEEKRYQIAKDLADNLTIGYNTSEVVMSRLTQTTSAKERVYQQAVSFFSTNEAVLTALKASFTGLFGLHESTRTLEAMKEGIDKSLETLSEIGDKVQEAAIKAGYGPTVKAESVKMLVDSVVNFQIRTREIINEMRILATRNSEEIREAVEDGKKRLARLAAEGETLIES
ncbi:MAG: cell surface protein [Alphaproteobacteria bacterium]|nr:cell surface protein [Alphaproteobacteria bacterium]